MGNPFKPTAGKMPPILIGRQSAVDDFANGLADGAGAPARLMLVCGQRGFGKTVMLTEFCRIAKEQGWETYSETASEGLCERLIEEIVPKHLQLNSLNVGPSIGIAGIGSASLGQAQVSSQQAPATLRKAINDRLSTRAVKKGKGILITIDEAQAASRDDLVAVATAVQHVIADQDLTDEPDSKKKGIAIVFAGLPALIDEVVNDKVLTFLRRSVRQDLGYVAFPDVKNAYIETVVEEGKSILEGVAERAARASLGYPYMIQLVGYYMWQSSEKRGSDAIEECDVEQGLHDAIWAFGDAVCAPALHGATPAERRQVDAMARFDGPVKVADLAEELGKSKGSVNKHRAALIAKGIAKPVAYGEIDFAIPYLREYLKRFEIGAR